MSNPTVLAEQTPTNILEWTDGAALVATGSPFGPVEYNGTTYRIGQANNALLFPGLGLGTIVCRAAQMSEACSWPEPGRWPASPTRPTPRRVCCRISSTCARSPPPSPSMSSTPPSPQV